MALYTYDIYQSLNNSCYSIYVYMVLLYIVGPIPKVPKCNFCRFLDFDINGKMNDQAILWFNQFF